jgi:hypothetical protein
MGWDGEENYKKAYIEAFIEVKKRELDMITWRHYKAWPLEVMRRFMGGCLNVNFEEGEEGEEGDDEQEEEVEEPRGFGSKRRRSLRSSQAAPRKVGKGEENTLVVAEAKGKEKFKKMGKAKGKLKVKKLTKEKDEDKPLGKRKVV